MQILLRPAYLWTTSISVDFMGINVGYLQIFCIKIPKKIYVITSKEFNTTAVKIIIKICFQNLKLEITLHGCFSGFVWGFDGLPATYLSLKALVSFPKRFILKPR